LDHIKNLDKTSTCDARKTPAVTMQDTIIDSKTNGYQAI